MQEEDVYYIIENNTEGFYKDKGSKFFAFAYPIANEEDIKDTLTSLKKKFFDARHYCYAFILGEKSEVFRASDDGEPSNSAGAPILNQIRSKSLTNTLVVVVRYFGGTKLGVSGLIHAYREAAKDALEKQEAKKQFISQRCLLTFDYTFLDKIMYLINTLDLTIAKQNFSDSCEIKIDVRLSLIERFKTEIKAFHQVNLSWENE